MTTRVLKKYKQTGKVFEEGQLLFLVNEMELRCGKGSGFHLHFREGGIQGVRRRIEPCLIRILEDYIRRILEDYIRRIARHRAAPL